MATSSGSKDAPFPELKLELLPDEPVAKPVEKFVAKAAPVAPVASPTVAPSANAPGPAPAPATPVSAFGALESAVALFNISVSFSPGIGADLVSQRAQDDLKLPKEKIESILRALQNGPKAMIGKAVPQDRADKAVADFTRIGMKVELTPVLSIQTKTHAADDGSEVCPACSKRVVLPANRQCPACHVFVDKVTDEFLLRRKLMEKERAIAEARLAKEGADSVKRNKDEMEKRLRELVRKEIEAEYGLDDKGGKSLFGGKTGKVRALAGVALLVAAVAAGRFTSGMGGDKAAEAKPAGPATSAVGQTIEQAKAAANGPNPEQAMAQALEKSLPDEVLAGIDPTDEESLLKAARGGGGGGMTMEQAVAASGALAKSVGNHTLEKAMNGTLPPGSPGAAGGAGAAVAAGKGSAAAPGGIKTSGATGPAIPVPSAEEVAAQGIALPRELKLALTTQLVGTLGEIGQTQRAQEIAKAVLAGPEAASDLQLAAQARSADIAARAWALNGQAPGKASQQAKELKEQIAKIADGPERAMTYAKTGAILAQHTVLPREAQVAMISLAGDTLKGLPAAQQAPVRDVWVTALGDSLLADTIEAARAGKWPRAQEAFKRLSEVAANPPSPAAAASLHGLEYRARIVMGQADQADAALAAGLAAAVKASNVADQARALHAMVARAGAPRTPFLTNAVNQMAEKAHGAPAGAGKSVALSELAQTLVALGQDQAAAKLREASREAASALQPMERSALVARMLVEGDLAQIKARNAEGNYAETEGLLRRVAGYLL